ncbi:MAG: 1-deoxy-D-xylulose-5-phosphate reductoisomerase, partial [Planctomycetes bacterium]|nr:1-deoxy-D-xylulose-5-phosphate reductoisomerase [Planctomycetota bacterium]
MSDAPRPLTILGATGSIGVNTLKVAAHLGIPVHAVTANGKVAELARLARDAKAAVAVVADESRYGELKAA